MVKKTLRPHQWEAVSKLKNGSILCGGVGSGKSMTAMAYFYKKVCKGGIDLKTGTLHPMLEPRELVVITTAKKRDSLDWDKEALGFGISTDPDLSEGGVQLTVDSWNNIKKYEGYHDAFFIFDEQRLVGSGAWVKAFYKIAKQNQWILLSATPGDVWSDYIPVFVANGFYKNKTDFDRNHVVYARYVKFPKIDRYVGTKKLEGHRDEVLVDMPFERHTTRHHHNHFAEWDREKMKVLLKDRWNFYEDEPVRDAGQLAYLMRRLVNSDPSRKDIVRRLVEENPRTIIFYNFNYELDILRGLMNEVGLDFAEWNGHKHEEVPTLLKWSYLTQYTAGAEGWNCTTTDSIIFYSLNYSYRLMQQAEGRIDRMNTPYQDLHYHVIRSGAGIDLAIWKALRRKETFNERAFIRKLEAD